MRNTLQPKLTILSRSFALLGSGLLALSLAACSGSKWHEVEKAPETGDHFAETQTAPEKQPAFHNGDTGFTTSDNTPVRDTPDQPLAKTPGHLEKNDKIEIIDSDPSGNDGSMKAVVVDTRQPDLKGKTVYVKKKYVSHSPVVPSNEEKSCDKYVMIQNIATEKVRVYQTCVSKDASGACVNRLVEETDMTAGEDTPKKTRQTMLGSYRIESWHKFYEDNQHFYPAFYAPGYPDLPSENASLEFWMSPSLLPKKGGVMRGSFGWYTAYLEPNADAQWTHGTFGWGRDGGKFIAAAKDPANDGKMDKGSQGCTRVENRAIALFREIMPACSRVVKVYAREDYADPTLAAYQVKGLAKWDWVLTKMNSVDAPKSGAKYAPSAKTNADEILDSGSFTLDQMPTAIPVDMSKDARHSQNGNVYALPASSMKGVFLVDEGRLAGYEHPSELHVGGQVDHKLPSVVISSRKDAKAVLPVAVATKTQK